MSQVTSLTVPNAVALSVRQGPNDLCGASIRSTAGHGARGLCPVAILGGYRQRHLKIRNADE